MLICATGEAKDTQCTINIYQISSLCLFSKNSASSFYKQETNLQVNCQKCTTYSVLRKRKSKSYIHNEAKRKIFIVFILGKSHKNITIAINIDVLERKGEHIQLLISAFLFTGL